ncbi:DNA-3-methyladenine glycosylase I [Cuneatibacter sp. NSJ-177]|uniref:DNA-3-methyladenine glycosylase I n=1 Tax=Cuneatibacter sp. NSJ-177 TaxID=2931401 RepID=UPI001FD044AD|nr:DNA-3-methyladenine glycosylase I [Cuneatibacter sp. NSJ-177]MCJ7836053.1 DNA-3-methyladenine glycosylase I [Cuneatibacter sp. NSJ-177]
MERCGWCLCNEKMMKYHDEEWGVPLFDDRKQFEFLTLEVMQCGLNWNMMIQKREIFRQCFEDFDYEKIAGYGEADQERILSTEGMIRSPRKIAAVIQNAKSFLRIREEYGTFSQYIWKFSKGKTLLYAGHQKGILPAKNALSDQVSQDLKKRGFRYLGSVTVYSHLQACGIINDHLETCFRYADLINHYPTARKRNPRTKAE